MEITEENLLSMIVSVGIGLTFFFIAAVSTRIYIKRKDRLLAYFALAWLSFGGMLIVSSLSYVMPSVMFQYIGYSVLAPMSLVFWFVFIDTTMNDKIGPKKTALSCVAGSILATFNLLMPWSWDGKQWVTSIQVFDLVFLQMSNVFFSILIISYSYWVFVTHKNAPVTLKRKTRVLLACGIAQLVGMVIQFSGDELLLLVQSVIIIVAMFITTNIINSTPEIAHLLPYKVYKLIITSKNGPKYYTKSWADSGIDDDMLAGLMSAIGTVVKNTLQKIKTGAISEIKMYNGVMLTEMRYLPVNIVLIASKSSVALKGSLEGFGEDFMKMFYDVLYDKDGFAKEVLDGTSIFTDEKVGSLVNKHFQNIPIYD